MDQKANNVADMNELMKVLSHVESLIDTGRDDSEIVPLCEQVTKRWRKNDLEKVRQDFEARTDSKSRLAIADFLNYRLFVSDNPAVEIYRNLKLAAEHPEPQERAMFQLGCCMKYGWACKADPEQAFQWFSRAAERSYADSIYALAEIYAQRKNWAEAEASFRKFLTERPDDYDALTALATLCLKQKAKKEEACEYLRRAVRVNPYGSEARKLLKKYFPGK